MLVFVGAKMTLVDVYKVPPVTSLVVVSALLGASIVASLIASRRDEKHRGALAA